MENYLPEELRRLEKLNIPQDKLLSYDVLILPENFDSNNKEEILDAQDSIQLSKLLKQSEISCANSYDLGFHDMPTIERRGNDLWLGQIVILNDVVTPIVVSVIANLVTPLLQHKRNKPDVRTPTGDIHTEITVKRGDDVANIKYKGDGETFLKIIEALKDKKIDG